MPYFTRQVAPNGSLMVRANIGVSRARREALTAANIPVPLPIPVDALVDTGASVTCVDPSVLQALGLTPTGQTMMFTPSTGHTPEPADEYDVSFLIFTTHQQVPLIHHAIPVMASNLKLGQGFEVLLGRDVLSGCLLTYDGLHGLFTLAY